MKPLQLACSHCPCDQLVVETNGPNVCLSANSTYEGSTDGADIILNRDSVEMLYGWLGKWLRKTTPPAPPPQPGLCECCGEVQADPCHSCGEPVCEAKYCQRVHRGLDGGLSACGGGQGR